MVEAADRLVAPDIAGEVRGYRVWVLSECGYLSSVTRPWPWQAGVNTAACDNVGGETGMVSVTRAGTIVIRHPPGEAVPARTCTCGMYAADDPRHPQIPAVAAVASPPGKNRVLGVVECSGGIVPHENGVFRAQHARVAALCLPGHVRQVTWDAVKHRYPGTELFSSRLAMLRKYPPRPLLDTRRSWWVRRHHARGGWVVAATAGVLSWLVALLSAGSPGAYLLGAGCLTLAAAWFFLP